jgi:uncharacterized repeat protein (TIGR02543 family)
MPAENVTFYAQWTVNQYTIDFEENGGGTVTNITQDYNTTIDVVPVTTKTGYTFNGWYTESIYENIISSPHTLVDDMTMYAKWKKEEESTPMPTPTATPITMEETQRKITVIGTVLDENGNPLAGMTVELHSDPMIVVTDEAGQFTFKLLRWFCC